MPRGGVITGRITDSAGRPVSNAGVDVLERVVGGGVVQLDRASFVVTDDRGVYRAYGLMPGSFVVAVSGADQLNNAARQTTAADVQWAMQPRSPGAAAASSAPPASPTVAFAPVYFPGTLDARAATSIAIEPGAERRGIDFAIQFVPMVRVSGTVTRSDGRPAAGMSLQLEYQAPQGLQLGLAPRGAGGRAVVSQAGEFEFASVAPGSYAITARLGTQDGLLWAREYVSVSGHDVTGVFVSIKPGVNVSGRIVVEGASPIALTAVSVSLAAPRVGPLGSSTTSFAAADGTFSLGGVIPSTHTLSASSRPGLTPTAETWMVKAVTVGGRDVFDRYFELPAGASVTDATITLTDKISSLSGKLLDADGKAAPEFFALLIPVDPTLWVQG